MKKILSAVLITISATMNANAQGGQFPPTYFPANANVCDPTPYKMVFYDDFNGTSVDRTKWITFNSYAGMQPSDTFNWDGGRLMTHNDAITLDENVTIKNGMARLIVRHQETTWKGDCSDCVSRTKHFSGGTLCTYYNYQGTVNAYNNGKFEARIKFPTFLKAHGDFWTWGSDIHPINSIDMAEAYGDPFNLFSNNRYCDYSLHEMPPSPNPYGLQNHELMSRYPNQSWWNIVRGTYFDQYNWHTYTCEWDTSVIKTYLDGNLVNTIYKWYRPVTIPNNWSFPTGSLPSTYTAMQRLNTCQIPYAGSWYILPGFPYDQNSKCQIRLTLDIDVDTIFHVQPIDTLGEMDIDYVKIWQRHPEDDHHSEVCPTVVPVITGPNIVCNTSTFNASPSMSQGAWTVAFPGLNSSGNSSSLTVTPPALFENNIINYKYSNPGCPDVNANKWIDVGMPSSTTATVTKVNSPNGIWFSLAAVRPFLLGGVASSPTTYQWTVRYGAQGVPTTQINGSGQFLNTQLSSNLIGANNVFVNWTLTARNSCGTIVKSGSKTWPWYDSHRTTGDGGLADSAYIPSSVDTAAQYWSAVIPDIDVYGKAVGDHIAQSYVSDANDTTETDSLIARIMIEELAPYIVLPDGSRFGSPNSNENATAVLSKQYKVFPNPVKNTLTISGQNEVNTITTITVHDISGRLVYRAGNIQFDKISNYLISTDKWMVGVYFVNVTNNKGISEDFKIVKPE